MLPALVFAWCGAAVFALSLLFFLHAYLVRFGTSVADGPALAAAAADVALFAVFAVHHSLLARPSLKARVQQLVPAPLERSVYTWTASLIFLGVCALWRPIDGQLYRLSGPAAAAGYLVQALGIALTARSAARLDVLELAGVRQVLDARADAPMRRGGLETRGIYGFVRHPVYFAWVLLVFGTPHMTMTRLVFAVVSTAYLAAAIPLEERSLIRAFGDEYQRYRERVRWRMIPGIY